MRSLHRPPQNRDSSCTSFRCGGIWRAKLSRFWTICLVRCASCRITCISLRALSGSSGFSISRSANPRMAVSGLLTSCATPETSWPTAAIFSACISFDCRRRIGDIGHHHHQAGHRALLVAHGTQVDGKMPDPAVPAQDLQFEIVHLLPAPRFPARLRNLALSRGSTNPPADAPADCFRS